MAGVLQDKSLIHILHSTTLFKMVGIVFCVFIVSEYLSLNTLLSYSAQIILACCILLIGAIIGFLKYKSVGFYIISVAFGVIIFANAYNNNDLITHNFAPSQPAIIKGTITQTLKNTTTKQSVIVEGNIYPKHLPELTNTKIILTIYKDTSLANNKTLNKGDNVLLKGSIRFPTEKVFKHDFDSKRYLRSKGASLMGSAYEKNVSI